MSEAYMNALLLGLGYAWPCLYTQIILKLQALEDSSDPF